MKDKEIREAVRKQYGAVARQGGSCCPEPQSSCCGPAATDSSCQPQGTAAEVGKAIGYNDEELASVPEGSNLGLGCGNPLALAAIQAGDTVLDLGSGAGFDCFLASARVGEHGKVIGVDMTPDMLEKARENAENSGHQNVEFRLGEIENLPLADDSVDLVISNCVINLSTRKDRVFQEAYRVLKPGGKLMISDIVLHRQLPKETRESLEAYAGCIAGASMRNDYLSLIETTGFMEVKVEKETGYLDTGEDQTAEETAGIITSISVSALKPEN